MTDLSAVVAEGLTNYYQMVQKQVHRWVAPISNDQFWRNPYSYGNSIGHLLLHLTGNLNYYIGARIAQTGYVRDRNREFTETARPPKEQVLEAFDRTIDMVVNTIREQSPEEWLAAYSAEREPEANERFTALLRCAGHAYHHVGQMIYLAKELEKQAAQKATVPGSGC